MASQIQLRRGTAASWTSVNPVLAQGEEGFETDTGKVKVGDGATAWAGLAYLSGGAAGLTSFQGRATAAAVLTKADVTGTGLAPADIAAATSAALAAEIAGSEHTANKGQPSGYAGLGVDGYVPPAQLATGPADATHFLRGDKTWGVVPGGGVPDASTTVKGVTELSTAPAVAGTPIAVGDNDPRNSNSRTPTAHKASHATGGSDVLLPSDIGAAQADHPFAGGNVTGAVPLNVSPYSGFQWTATLTGNTALTISGMPAQGKGKLLVAEDATGTWTLSVNGIAVPLDTTALAKAAVNVTFDGTNYWIDGQRGPAGPGVPVGGATGQVLAKSSNADFATGWVAQSGGGAAPALWTPSTSGLLAASFPTKDAVGQRTLPPGYTVTARVPFPVAGAVGNVSFFITVAGTGLGLSNALLYTLGGVLIARTADQSTVWNTVGLKEPAWIVESGQSLTRPAADMIVGWFCTSNTGNAQIATSAASAFSGSTALVNRGTVSPAQISGFSAGAGVQTPLTGVSPDSVVAWVGLF